MITLQWLRASVECEGCGRTFRVELDPADLHDGMDFHDLVAEAVANGNRCTDDGDGFTSVQCDLVLCRSCTAIADDIPTPGDRVPTREELVAALEAALAKSV